MNDPDLRLTMPSASLVGTFPAYFPAETIVSRDAKGRVVSRYGDVSWDLTSMSADGTSALMLHFLATEGSTDPELAARIREQHKALMWLYIDAGKVRAPMSIRIANYAIAAWWGKAGHRGVDLFTLLTNPKWVSEDSESLTTSYIELMPGLIQTLWRHSGALGLEPGIELKALKQALRLTTDARPDSRQTPLIPSRVYCGILAGLAGHMDLVERNIDVLLDAYRCSMAASRAIPIGASPSKRKTYRAKALAGVIATLRPLGYDPALMVSLEHFIAGRISECQVGLMLTVAAFSGMRKGEVFTLPLQGCLRTFEHLGATHYELHGFTQKLNNGQKTPASWITSRQGGRAVELAKRIARTILAETKALPNGSQQALLFPSTASPFRCKNGQTLVAAFALLRNRLCPLVEQADIDELDSLELERDWQRDDIKVGNHWPLAFHQLRRSLAVYAHRSGMVTLPALKAQLQHITQEMTSYYADGYSRAINLVFDKDHFSHEWSASKTESSYFGYTLGLLFSDEDFFGGVGVQRMSGVLESRSRAATLRLFTEKKLAFRETVLGGCVSTEECKVQPLEPIPYDCLESNCPNMVVFSKRLQAVVRSQKTLVLTLEREMCGSVEHRLEARHLEVLLKAQAHLEGGS